jgi:hypothetical protein
LAFTVITPETTRPRRFPPPWSVEELEACFVEDSASQKLAYVYFEEKPGRRSAAKLLTKDEARRIAVNIAKFRSCCASRVSASIFDIGQSTLGLEGFSYGCKHLKYALTAPGTHRCNADWPYGRSSQCRRP